MKLPAAGERLRALACALPNRAARRAGTRTGHTPRLPGRHAVAQGAARFGLVYSGLYCLTNPQILPPLLGGGLVPRQAAEKWSEIWAIRPVRKWVAAHVFHTSADEGFQGLDNRYAWVGQFCWLAAAATITPVWSALDRDGTGYRTVRPWIQLAIRMSLAGQMFYYGAAKAVPVQFRTPLSRFVEPFGNFTPMDLLWAHTGHSKPYQILLGSAEITGGLLLSLPRTATLGALLSAVELAQVLVLNMAFDVPVKLHSFHLLLLSLVLLEPEAARLAKAFLWDRTVHLPARPRLLPTARADQVAAAAQVLAGAWMLSAQLRNDRGYWRKLGDGGEKPALYGIWHVDEFSVDGERRPPLTTDKQRWQRVVFDIGSLVSVQLMDDSLDGYLTTSDPAGRSLTLTRTSDPQRTVTLAVERAADDLLTLDGDVDGSRVRARLHRLDHGKFPLLGRGFHWVQEQSSLR